MKRPPCYFFFLSEMNCEKKLLDFHLLEAETDEEEVMMSNSSSRKTSSNSTPGTTWAKDGDKIPNQVMEWTWEEIDAELLTLGETDNGGNKRKLNLLKPHCEESDPDLKKQPLFIDEAEIRAKIRDPLLPYIFSVVSTEGDKLKSIYKGAGNPDTVIKNNEITIIVGEIKTFWSYKIDESTKHLADIWNDGRTMVNKTYTRHDYYMSHALSNVQENKSEAVKKQYSFENKVFHLLVQHFKQMHENSLIYGFMTTWNYWWITKQEKSGKFCISKAFKHNNRSPSILQLFGRLCKTAKADTNYEMQMDVESIFEVVDTKKVFKSPQEANRREKRPKTTSLDSESKSSSTSSDQTIMSLTLHYNKLPIVNRLLQITRAPRRDLCINDNGCVVRCLMKDEPDQVMKFTWVPDYPEAEQLYEHECQVYKKLERLQGTIIPKMDYHHPFWFSGIGGTLAMAMSYVGKSLTKDKLSTLSHVVREEAVGNLHQIHKLGVLHGDLRLPNIVWNEKAERIMFIDFGFSKLIQDKRLSEKEVYMEEIELRKLLELDDSEVEKEPSIDSDTSSE